MSLEIDFLVGGSVTLGGIPARECVLHRTLGKPVRWEIVAVTPHDRPQLRQFAEALEAGPVAVRPAWRHAGETILGQPAVITEAAWLPGAADSLRLAAQGTDFDSSEVGAQPAPLVPRHRVHHVDNLLRLVRRLSHVARVTNAVAQRLERIRFPEGERTSLIQDGVSDWDFLHEVLRQYAALETEAPLRTLLCTGSVDERARSAGHWLVTWGDEEAYRAFPDVEGRDIAWRLDDGREQVSFGEPRTPESDAGPALRGAVVSRTRVDRPFDAGSWESWRTRDLPLFTPGERFVCSISDRFYRTNTAHLLGWSSCIRTRPASAPSVGIANRPRVRPWLGLGKVVEAPPAGPWVIARLPAFEGKEGADLVHARLLTPSAGSRGDSGLHLVPKENTHVLLAWSGWFRDPVIVLGNVRKGAARFPAPSLELDEMARLFLQALEFEHVGRTHIASDLSIAVDGEAELASAKAQRLGGDGATVELRKGEVHTGYSP
jgi:hypothetical protein